MNQILKPDQAFGLPVPGVEMGPVCHDFNPTETQLGDHVNCIEQRVLHKGIGAVSELQWIISRQSFSRLWSAKT